MRNARVEKSAGDLILGPEALSLYIWKKKKKKLKTGEEIFIQGKKNKQTKTSADRVPL